uniref:Uncharacterized protein n=1 Tax=Myoviridae sp. ctBrv3 TaxID=2825047 RepID=A0A8S5PD97_9CAUD|nr:MAG TPA: hypothetical protein [Myoviridae sp. ctBrv3]
MNMTNRVSALYKYYKLTDEMVRYNFYRCTTFLFFSKIRLEANTLFIIIN